MCTSKANICCIPKTAKNEAVQTLLLVTPASQSVLKSLTCRDLPQRLQEELQKELQLDTALREQVAKAKEDLARLEEEKGKLLDTEQSSRARRNPWQERVAAHNAALNDLNRQKVCMPKKS